MSAALVLDYVRNVIEDGLLVAPRMFGTAEMVEVEFLTLLEVQLCAEGYEFGRDVKDEWHAYVDRVCGEQRSAIALLAHRRQWPGDLVDFSACLRTFYEVDFVALRARLRK